MSHLRVVRCSSEGRRRNPADHRRSSAGRDDSRDVSGMTAGADARGRGAPRPLRPGPARGLRLPRLPRRRPGHGRGAHLRDLPRRGRRRRPPGARRRSTPAGSSAWPATSSSTTGAAGSGEERKLRAVAAEPDRHDDPWDARLDVLEARATLDRLGPANRLALTLRYLDGLSIPEMARGARPQPPRHRGAGGAGPGRVPSRLRRGGGPMSDPLDPDPLDRPAPRRRPRSPPTPPSPLACGPASPPPSTRRAREDRP